MTKICLIASNQEEAYRFARSQYLEKNQWFYAKDLNDILFKSNFHVIVVGLVGLGISAQIFEKFYQVALQRGRIGRI